MQESKLDFAYKYPFSQEAKAVVAEMKVSSVDQNYLKEGVSRLKSAFADGKVPYEKVRGMSDVKYRYIMSYVYARMLVSAIGDRYSISRFAGAEAKTAAEFLSLDSAENVIKLAGELNLNLRKENGGFAISFEKFISVPKKGEMMKLANQSLTKGIVHVDERQLRKLVGGATEKEINSRLPIDKKDLPREIIEASKGLRPQEPRISIEFKPGTYNWIEKLMQTPIADVRHRTVNLILAPYLVNVKKMDEEGAAKTIIDYIERCKAINPNTKINEQYIRYQCRYAKNKGLRPLSLTRARDLLSGMVEFE